MVKIDMGPGPQIALLADGRRLHLQHGPIDLIVESFGDKGEIELSYRQAASRFQTVLSELVEELPALRKPCGGVTFKGPTARRMADAVSLHRRVFVTPMAAVAGAVADEVLSTMLRGRDLARAYVNNGGDIALYLSPGEKFAAGLVGRPVRGGPDGVCQITSDMPVRGIATSGRGGRSFSLGIADAVTVLARNAATADAAATLIGNSVNVEHPAIRRAPAMTLDPDSDLGNLEVTTAVGELDGSAVRTALDSGAACAQAMRAADSIHGAVLALDGIFRVVGDEIARELLVAA